MSESAIKEQIRQHLQAVYNKSGGGMSGKMLAVAECILDLPRSTDPSIAEMAVVNDGVVVARLSDDIGMNEVIADASSLRDNFTRLLDAMALDDKQLAYASEKFNAVTVFGRSLKPLTL